jgi:integrase
MTTRRRRGEDGISFEHRGPCRDPQRHRHCPGLWRGEVSLGYTEGAKRNRRKVSGTTKAAVVDKLRELHKELDQGIVPKTGYANYTVRQAAEDWLANGLDGRAAKTIKKNQNVLEPILKVIGSRRLRELTAGDVRQASSKMAADYSSAAVTMGHLALKRAIRHAEANDLVARNVATLVETPKGQEGPRRSPSPWNRLWRSSQLPGLCPPSSPGLKDVRRPTALMYAYIVLSLLVGVRTEEARALRWQYVNLDGDPDLEPPVPPHVAVWRSVRVHGETKTERSRRTLGLPQMAVEALRALRESQARERALAGEQWQDIGLVFTTHLGTAVDAGNVRKMFKRVCKAAGIGDGWTPRELRTSFVSLMSHRGVSIEEIARLAGHASTRTTEVVYRRELRPVITTGAEIMDEVFRVGKLAGRGAAPRMAVSATSSCEQDPACLGHPCRGKLNHTPSERILGQRVQVVEVRDAVCRHPIIVRREF